MSKIIILIAIVLAALLAAGCTSNQGPAAPISTPATTPGASGTTGPLTIMTANNSTLGTYLVDGNGMTLYYFADDAPNSGESSCGDTCVQYWPPFHTGQIILHRHLSWFDVDTIYREDGSAQITYKGWPLYYYTNDYNPGEIRGQGINGVWFVAGPGMMP